MKVLTVEQVIELHTRLIQATGGLDCVRDQTTPNMIQRITISISRNIRKVDN